MHIAQFVHRYPPALGGAEAYARRLTNFLQASGDTVDIWTTTAEDLAAFRGCGRDVPADDHRRYKPLHFPLQRYLLKAASLLPYAPLQALTLPCSPICPAMWREAGSYEGALDAVHATAFPYSFPMMCARRLARRRKVPLVMTPFLHLGDPADVRDRTRRQYLQAALCWLLTEADCIFVQTAGEFAAVRAAGVPRERIVLQGLGVDADECSGGDRDAARRSWGVSAATIVVGHLANNSIEKGTVDLLRAVETLPDVRTVLAGPAMPNFERFWTSYSAKARVHRVAVLSEAAKRDFYAGIDLFVLPSRSDSFGLVLLEAWANGKPVVVYRAGGPGELVRNGGDGCVVKCGDLPGLTAAIAKLSQDVKLRTRTGDAGRERLPEFRWADKLAIFRNAILAAIHT